MRDAYGGILNIVIVVVFLVIISGYLAFNVNYTKAFRLKNEIISTLEEYEGAGWEQISPGCTRALCTKINNYASQIGYNVSTINQPNNDGGRWNCDKSIGYCVGRFEVNSEGGEEKKGQVYYRVITQININIPIINNIMGLRIFQVSGSTKTITEN